MQLARPEYVTVFDFYEDAPAFTRNSTALSQKAMINTHDTGRLFMMFHPHNDHVSRQTYLLNDDVLGNYYVSDSGQIVLTSYTQEGIRTLEWDFCNSESIAFCELVGKYQFDEPILAEFINSGFEDFADFAMLIAKDMYDEEDPE